MTITEFLLARVTEDEERAKAAFAGPWAAGSGEVESPEDTVAEVQGYGNLIFITANDPTRALAECAAKRAIIAAHPDGNADYRKPDGSYLPMFHGYCETCTVDHSGAPWPCTTLRALASVYADHTGYDESWAL